MADEGTVAEERRSSPEPPRRSLGRRVVAVLLLAGVIVGGFLLGAAVIPRWWAQRVGGLVDGRMTVGSLAGFVAGAACTFLPLLALWAAFRFRRGRRRAIAGVVTAAVLALPNLFLLGIVLGDGSAAHAGERILDVDGPGFRGASLLGAIVGGLGFVAVLYLALSRKSRGRRADRLRRQLDDRDRDRDREEAGHE